MSFLLENCFADKIKLRKLRYIYSIIPMGHYGTMERFDLERECEHWWGYTYDGASGQRILAAISNL